MTKVCDIGLLRNRDKKILSLWQKLNSFVVIKKSIKGLSGSFGFTACLEQSLCTVQLALAG